MKKLLFILTILFFSCEKEIIEKETCWRCTETIKKSGVTLNVIETRVCDVLEVTKLDGKRTIKITASGHVITHFTECELEY